MDFIELVIREKELSDLKASGAAKLTGDEAALTDLLSFLDTFDFWFEIVMP
jgi:alkyl sulfatase BDS1-like metallo-beta-lactamase superfamily hydrolase